MSSNFCLLFKSLRKKFTKKLWRIEFTTSYRTHSQRHPMRRSNLMTCHKENRDPLEHSHKRELTGKWHDLREWPVGHRRKEKKEEKKTDEGSESLKASRIYLLMSERKNMASRKHITFFFLLLIDREGRERERIVYMESNKTGSIVVPLNCTVGPC